MRMEDKFVRKDIDFMDVFLCKVYFMNNEYLRILLEV